MATHTMFVYGTLKQTHRNHNILKRPQNGVSKFLGRGHTVNRYPLVVDPSNNLPFVLYEDGKGKIIQGELYEVDDKMLSVLDQLEGHPDFYERDLVPVVLTADDQSQTQAVHKQCWIYFLKRYKPELLDLPCYESYNSR